jgi:hypothetical protein
VECAGTAEWTKDYDGAVPSAQPDSTFAAIVVDAASGAPLGGARLRLYLEDTSPTGIPGAPIHEAKADEFGVVSVPGRDEYKGCHFVFEAPGYAPLCNFGAPEGRVELRPGLAWSGQLPDPSGRPAAGVALEYCTGRPHAPAPRRTTTRADELRIDAVVRWREASRGERTPAGFALQRRARGRGNG